MRKAVSRFALTGLFLILSGSIAAAANVDLDTDSMPSGTLGQFTYIYSSTDMTSPKSSSSIFVGGKHGLFGTQLEIGVNNYQIPTPGNVKVAVTGELRIGHYGSLTLGSSAAGKTVELNVGSLVVTGTGAEIAPNTYADGGVWFNGQEDAILRARTITIEHGDIRMSSVKSQVIASGLVTIGSGYTVGDDTISASFVASGTIKDVNAAVFESGAVVKKGGALEGTSGGVLYLGADQVVELQGGAILGRNDGFTVGEDGMDKGVRVTRAGSCISSFLGSLSIANTLEVNTPGEFYIRPDEGDVTVKDFRQIKGETSVFDLGSGEKFVVTGSAEILGGSFSLGYEYPEESVDSIGIAEFQKGFVLGDGNSKVAHFGGNGDLTIGAGFEGVVNKGSSFAVEGGSLALHGNMRFAAGSIFKIGADGASLSKFATGANNITVDTTTGTGSKLGLTAAAKKIIESGYNTADTVFDKSGGTVKDASNNTIADLSASSIWGNDASAQTISLNTGRGTATFNVTADSIVFDSYSGPIDRNGGNVNSGANASAYWASQGMNISGYAALSPSTFKAMDSLVNSGVPLNATLMNVQLALGQGDDGVIASQRELDSLVSSVTGLSQTNVLRAVMDTNMMITDQVDTRINQLNSQARAASDQFGSDRALASAVLNSCLANRLWIAGIGTWQDLDAKNNVPGYEYNAGGAMIGYDRFFGPFAIGGSFAYSHGSLKDRSALSNDSKIDNYSINLYGTYRHDSGIFASLFGGYSYSDNDISKYRAGIDALNNPVRGWERSDYGVNSWTVGGKIGYDFCLFPALTITPSIGIIYQDARANDFDSDFDYGSGDTRTRFTGLKNHSLSMPVNLAVSYDVLNNGSDTRLAVSANAGYAYEFHNKAADGTMLYDIVNSPAISVAGREPGRNTWNFGAGVKYEYKRFEFGVKYDYYKRSDLDAHRVVGSVGINF